MRKTLYSMNSRLYLLWCFRRKLSVIFYRQDFIAVSLWPVIDTVTPENGLKAQFHAHKGRSTTKMQGDEPFNTIITISLNLALTFIEFASGWFRVAMPPVEIVLQDRQQTIFQPHENMLHHGLHEHGIENLILSYPLLLLLLMGPIQNYIHCKITPMVANRSRPNPRQIYDPQLMPLGS